MGRRAVKGKNSSKGNYSCRGNYKSSYSYKRGNYKKNEGEIQDKKALNALFNKIIQYLIINSYISTIIKLYI